jgi:GntR family transcriptional regulator/MocR family aminotransferase
MLTYGLNRRGNRTKSAFLYEKIKEDILNGKLKPGEKMPSKRMLSEHLSISIITVDHAYQDLTAEGYLSARERSGFYVCEMLLPETEKKNLSPARVYLKEEKKAVPADRDEEHCLLTVARITRKILSAQPEILLMKPSHSGCASLRNALADYLFRFRGMNVQPEQIVIGSGAEYLYGLIVQLLGRDILYAIEDPSYGKIRAVYEANGARCEMLEMDKSGISERALNRSRAGVLHTTPFHSYPSGVTAQAAKRYRYIKWAQERKGFLIEDDYDSEFAFLRKPIETIYAMDRSESVIYLNTFSKSLLPSVRIGYMVLPKRLLGKYSEKLGFYSCTVPVLDQHVLAEFIKTGSFERHLNRIRQNFKHGNAEK